MLGGCAVLMVTFEMKTRTFQCCLATTTITTECIDVAVVETHASLSQIVLREVALDRIEQEDDYLFKLAKIEYRRLNDYILAFQDIAGRMQHSVFKVTSGVMMIHRIRREFAHRTV